jgi:hypothetical protein
MAGRRALVDVGYGSKGLQCLPANVPLPDTRNARNGRVRPLNAGYLRDAAATPRAPKARPAAPPITPPFSVALGES